MTTARETLDRSMGEDALQTEIIKTAHQFGWLVAHFRPGQLADGSWRTPVQADGDGFPDLVCVNPKLGKVIFAELKSETGKLSAKQQAWIEAVGKVDALTPWVMDGERAEYINVSPVRVFVWRPSDLSSGEIDRVLSGKDGRT